MNLNDLLTVVVPIIIPIVGCAVWLAGRLARLEGEIRAMNQIRHIELQGLDARISRLEKHFHDIRNYLQSLSITVVKGLNTNEPPYRPKSSDDTHFGEL